ncbi:hypothetical protein ACFL40_02480 [candidate division KSB1 bacterium]
MEPYKVYMYGTNPRNDWKYIILCGIAGIIFIFLHFQFDFHYLDYPFIAGILYLLFAAGFIFLIKRNFIAIDEEGIKSEFQKLDNFLPPYLARLKKVYVKWEEIQSLSKEPLKISITLKDNSQKEIYIGDLSYKTHQELKGKLQEYIEAKGITTTI